MFSPDQVRKTRGSTILPWLLLAPALPLLGVFHAPLLTWGLLSSGIFVLGCAGLLAWSRESPPSALRLQMLVAGWLVCSVLLALPLERAVADAALREVERQVPLSDQARSLRVLQHSSAAGPALDARVQRMRRDHFLASDPHPSNLRSSARRLVDVLEPDELDAWLEALQRAQASEEMLLLLERRISACPPDDACLSWRQMRRRALVATSAADSALSRAWQEDLERWDALWAARLDIPTLEQVALQGDFLAHLLESALDAREVERLEASHARLSWMLPHLRGFGYPLDLLHALRRHAHADYAALWPLVDVRTVIPVLEAYHDQEDFAAMERLITAGRTTAQGPLLDGYATLVRAARAQAGTLRVTHPSGEPVTCRLRINGRAVDPEAGAWTLVPGSHALACETEEGRVVRRDWSVSPRADRTWIVDLALLP